MNYVVVRNEKKHYLTPGTVVKHFKGGIYEIKEVAKYSEDHSKLMIVYTTVSPAPGQEFNKDGNTWVRPLDMFLSEVDREKYPDVEQKYRFEFIEEFRDNVEGELYFLQE